MSKWRRSAWVAGLVGALAGCGGQTSSGVDDAGGPGASGGSGQAGGLPAGGSPSAGAGGDGGASAGSGGAGGAAAGSPGGPAHTLPLRRLTPFELDNALRDLTGDQSGAAYELHPGRHVVSETSPADNLLGLDSSLALEAIVYGAAKVAAQDPDALLGCAPAAPGDACVQGFVRSFGRRAFRRPLLEAEVTDFAQIEAELEPAFGRGEAVARTVQAMLLSPDFLYLTSFGLDDAAFADTGPDVPLDDHELASRLSFFLWGTLPDETLLAAADAGQLRTAGQVEAQVDRMLGAEFAGKSSNAAARFVAGWLGILDLPITGKSDPAWNPSLVRSMLSETDALVRDWFTKGERGIAGLVDADYSFVDENLAQLYGIGGVSGGVPVKVAITEQARRRGVMAHASVLAAHATSDSSSPVVRGAWLLENALCGTVPPPPAGSGEGAPPGSEGQTTREWNQAILDQPSCGGCHVHLAPQGFLFEDFDPIGRRRDTDVGKPVLTSATLETGVAAVDGALADHQAFASKLAASEALPACVAEHWLGYALATTSLDEATKTSVSEAMKVSARDAMRAIATSASFRLARRNVSNP